MSNTFFAGQTDYIEKLNVLALANDVAQVPANAAAAQASANSASTSATNANTSASTATTAASASQNNANTAQASNTSVQSLVAGIASSAAQAANSRNQAIIASQVATAANEVLAAQSQSIHSGNIVKLFAYDTSKDSDGGAWVKRCQDKSWFNETLGGDKWSGQAVNELAARGDNLIPYPEDFDLWSVVNLTIAKNTSLAPDGTTTAETITATATSHALTTSSMTVIPGTVMALSFYAKRGTMTEMKYRIRNVTASSEIFTPVSYYAQTNADTLSKVTQVFTVPAGCTSLYVSLLLDSGVTGTVVLAQAKLNAVGVLPSTYINSPELVTNGDFSNGTVGWTAQTGSSISVVNGALRVMNDSGGKGADTSFATVVGKTYRISFDLVYSSPSYASYFRLGSTFSANNLGERTNSNNIVFTAVSATTYLNIVNQNGSIGFYMDADNVSCKEVTTFATPYVPYSQLVGTVYQNTADKKFYSLNSTYGQTEVFRGISREFPATSMIVAESGRVIIYDTSTVGCPMWMVTTQVSSVSVALDFFRAGRSVSSVSAAQGVIYFGTNTSTDTGLCYLSFIKDDCGRVINTTQGGNGRYVANRNVSADLPFRLPYQLVNQLINDIAVTVLDNAPIDPATGMRIPTIAIATQGGVSVIKDDGTVVNSSRNDPMPTVGFTREGALVFSTQNNDSPWDISQNYLVPSFQGYALAYPNGIPAMLGRSSARIGSAYGRAVGNAFGSTLLRANPSSPTKGMVAAITNAYATGWQVGDSRLATLSDTVAETITASGELVTNGTFDTDISGWTGSDITWESGQLKTTLSGGQLFVGATRTINTVSGRNYRVTADYTKGTGSSGNLRAGASPLASTFGIFSLSASGIMQFDFIATSALTHISFIGNGNADGHTQFIDNISVKLAEPDRSVKNKGLILNGTLTKSAVAAGSNLMAYSGFSASNYLEQPYNSDLDFGTGDFSVMGWAKVNSIANSFPFFHRAVKGLGGGLYFRYQAITKTLDVYISNANTFVLALSAPISMQTGLYFMLSFFRNSGVLYITINSEIVASTANTVAINQPDATVLLGLRQEKTEAIPGAMSLWRVSATAPSADQIAFAYRTELPLFQPGAQCTIDGTSSTITAMAYDDSTDLLQVGTSWGRSSFKDLLRVDSEVSTIGAITTIAANNGQVSIGSSTGSSLRQPSMKLRSELTRRIEAARLRGNVLVPFEFDAITGQTSFTLLKGYTAVSVYSGELKKREGATKTWTRSFDGFAETINFAVAPGNAVWVSILAKQSN
jgi:hypothetical protein